MQRNQRAPGGLGGGNVPPQYEWHPQAQTREIPPNGSSQNYPAHPMTHPHIRGGILPHVVPPGIHSGGGGPISGHMVPLLPHPQSYPPGGIQAPLHSGGGGLGAQIRPKTPEGQNFVPHSGALQQQLQQVNIGDISVATISLADLAARVKNLGFPVSCSFVIGLLERYFSSQLDGKEKMPGPLQLSARSNLISLINMFVLCKTSSLTTPPPPPPPPLPPRPAPGSFSAGPGEERKGSEDIPMLGAIEEMQLLLTLHNQLEEQKNLELRYCVFEAIFSAEAETSSGECGLLKKLLSLSVSLESKGTLLCIAIWMNAHPLRALSLAQYLFQEFCVLLPNGMDPLLGLASFSPHMAYQIAAAFTTLHPFHVVGKLLPGVDTSHLYPSIKMLQILSHWVDSSPEFFYSLHHKDLILSKLPLLHPHSMRSDSHAMRSPITGIIQWCILAPMVNDTELYSKSDTTTTTTTTTKTGTNTTASDCNFQQLLAQLHADVLSVLLSLSQLQAFSRSSSSSTGPQTLNSDDVAMIVAALIAYNQKQDGVGECNKRVVTDGSGGAVAAAVAKEKERKMEESVERFAQFLQISLSEKVLELKQDDMNSIASNLPKNRLLELVISHCKSIH